MLSTNFSFYNKDNSEKDFSKTAVSSEPNTSIANGSTDQKHFLEDTRYEKFPEDFKIGNYLHHLDPSPKQEKEGNYTSTIPAGTAKECLLHSDQQENFRSGYLLRKNLTKKLGETAKVPDNNHKLFLPGVPDKNQKLYNTSKLIAWDEAKNPIKDGEKLKYPNLHYPDSTDTEFYTPKSLLSQNSRIGLSTQSKGIHPDAPKKIFWHSSHAKELNEARVKVGVDPLPVAISDAHFVDYLNSCGVPANIEGVKPGEVLKDLPIFTYTMNAHFATAELLMVFSGSLKAEIRQWIQKKVIIARRRLLIENFSNNSKKSEDWVQFENSVIEIDGIRYALRLRIIDTCAIHGVAGYADVAQNVGWALKDKDKLSKKDKGKMLDIALKKPADFEAYALGDLDVWDILAVYDVKWREVYKILDLEKYYREPALTIGASVRDLFCASLASKLHIGTTNVETGEFKWKKEFDEQVKPWIDFNATEIRSWIKSSAVLLCKVEGGRCRNNRPNDVFIKRKTTNGYDATYDQNIIIDIDISGCYGEGQRNQLFFLGHPAVMELDIKQNKERYNKYPSIRKTIESLGVKIEVLVKAAKEKNLEVWQNSENWGELIAGGYMMRVSTSEPLKYGQDFFASWFTPTGHKTNIMAKFIKQNLATDTELVDNLEGIDFDEKYGITKIFENEVHNGILTHDGLQWILVVASDRQRNELLDKLCVLAGAYYPKSMELKPTSWESAISELNEVYDNWQGRNTFTVTDAKTGATQQNYNSCHAWIGINLGELIVNKLLIERKKAQIKFGKKSPLDQLFKLCVNTLYGDMVSPYFIISNPIVGNNITARARALAWYMEKGFNGFQSITDGCGFEGNKVLFSSRDKINGELIGSVRDRKIKQRMIDVKPLGSVNEILMNETGELFIRKDDKLTSIGKGADNPWLNEKAMEHLQNLFSCVDVLHVKTTKLSVDKKSCEPIYIPRIGQFSFETKDTYFAGAFHGSANYIFQKNVIFINGFEADKEQGNELIKNERLNEKYPCLEIIKSHLEKPLSWKIKSKYFVKMRGYETNKFHGSIKWERDLEPWELGLDSNEEDEYFGHFLQTGRYGDDNNPGKDFMIQLLNNPESITRQEVAIKEGIFKIGEYTENPDKWDNLSIEPGDSVKRRMLMQEFSMTQFTFKTYEQYMNWKKVIETDKTKQRQSLEGFFLNGDGKPNFIKMTEWVADAIERGVMNPYEELDCNRHKTRDRQTSHPSLEEYEMIGRKLDNKVLENIKPEKCKKTKTRPKTSVKNLQSVEKFLEIENLKPG